MYSSSSSISSTQENKLRRAIINNNKNNTKNNNNNETENLSFSDIVNRISGKNSLKHDTTKLFGGAQNNSFQLTFAEFINKLNHNTLFDKQRYSESSELRNSEINYIKTNNLNSSTSDN